jgi:hypothetical protein
MKFRREYIIYLFLILVIGIGIYLYYYKKTAEKFDVTLTLDQTNVVIKLIKQFESCFTQSSQNITSTEYSLLTVGLINSILGDIQYKPMSRNITYDPNPNTVNFDAGLYALINIMIIKNLYLYGKTLYDSIQKNYCDVNKTQNRLYNDFNNLYRTELDKFYNICVCLINNYRKIIQFANQSNQNASNFQSFSGFQLSTDALNDLKVQLNCMVRLKLPISNPTIGTGNPDDALFYFAEEVCALIVNFATDTACNTVDYVNTDRTCYNICGKNLSSDALYGAIKPPSKCGNSIPVNTLNPSGATIITEGPSRIINAQSFISLAPTIRPTSTTSPTTSTPTSTPTASSSTPSSTPTSTSSSTPTSRPTASSSTPSSTPTSTPTSTPSSTPSSTPTSSSSTPTSRPTASSSTPTSTPTSGPTTIFRPTIAPTSGPTLVAMTHPYVSPNMPNEYLPEYSDIYPNNVFSDIPYAEFDNYTIRLENSKGFNNFFIPKIFIEEEFKH